MADVVIDPYVSHLPAALSVPLCGLAGKVGVSPDQIILLLCFVAAIPLGFLHKRIPSTTGRHVYSVLFGFLFMYVQYGVSALHPFVSATITYGLVQILPAERIGSVVFMWSIAYMSASHLYRMWVDYLGYHIDFTTSQMVVTVKMVTFAYNIQDGIKLKNKQPLHARPDMATTRAGRALTELPSVLEYYSFMFFYAGVLIGPCYEATDYFQTMDGSAAKKAGLTTLPSAVGAVIKCLFSGVLCYVGVFISGMLPTMGYIDSAAFLERPIVYRFFYIWAAVTAGRFKYYFAWFMSETGCIASGLGFNGVKKSKDSSKPDVVLWDRVNNVDVLRVEFGQSIFDLTNNWNKGVNNWLKHYVYFRIERPSWLPINEKTFANVVTKTTSALWHGFYSAYYLFFLGGALVNEVNNLTHAIFRPFFLLKPTESEIAKATAKGVKPEGAGNYPLKYVYDWVGWACLMSVMNYLGCAFMLLRWQTSVQAWGSVYYFGHLAPIVVAALALAVRATRRGGGKRDKSKSADGAAAVSVKKGATDSSDNATTPAPASTATAATTDSTERSASFSFAGARSRSKKA